MLLRSARLTVEGELGGRRGEIENMWFEGHSLEREKAN